MAARRTEGVIVISQPDQFAANDPADWSPWSASALILSCDLGFHADHCATALVGYWPRPVDRYGVTHIKQYPLETSLTDFADAIAAIAHTDMRIRVVVDVSNNPAFVEILAPRITSPSNRLIPVRVYNARDHDDAPKWKPAIVNGVTVAIQWWTLSKGILVDTFTAAMSNRLLNFSTREPSDYELLQREFRAYRRQPLKNGAYSYSAGAGEHDDLLMSTGGGLWGCRQFAEIPQLRRRSIYRPRPPSALAWT
jgi:hypothetical protein